MGKRNHGGVRRAGVARMRRAVCVALTALTALAAVLLGGAPPAVADGLRQGDDYDVWCENVEVCHRRINGYIAESKGNATYFSFEQGFIGDFDIILRINLNGRQPRWQVTVILDRGPALQFNEIWVNCGQAVDFLPDATCGPNFMGAPRLDRVGARWTSQLVFGERLPMEGEYYGVVAGTVFPAGQPMAMIPRLESMHFTCPASPAGCAFPLPRSYQDTGSLANPRN